MSFFLQKIEKEYLLEMLSKAKEFVVKKSSFINLCWLISSSIL